MEQVSITDVERIESSVKYLASKIDKMVADFLMLQMSINSLVNGKVNPMENKIDWLSRTISKVFKELDHVLQACIDKK